MSLSNLKPDLSVTIAGKTLSNPVGIASGIFGFGDEYSDFKGPYKAGAIYTKAVTPEYRGGNTPPRLAETTAGMLNSIGLANPGLDGFIKDKVPVLEKLKSNGVSSIVNVAGSVSSDYVKVAEAVDRIDAVWGMEINVSCPNVDHGGMAFGTDPAVLEKLVAQIRAVTSKPLIVKLSPNVTDITETAKAAVGGGADALSCINTLTGMKIDINKQKPVIPRGTGGLSGPAIRPVGVAAVWKVAKAVDVPVIGIGGITNANDALEYLLAGASAVQVGSAVFAEPQTPSLVLSGIVDYMTRRGYSKISEMHGLF
jgi:dihydroorotate dehydrogenase (NAD+) catalytic subunit